MPLKTDSIEEPNLNLTPMIDIVFLLIIFFMVGTRFTELEQQYDVKLPKVSQALTPSTLTEAPDPMVINVYRDGRVVLNAKEVTLQLLTNRLTEAKQNFPDQMVVIRGEGEGAYQHIIDVMAVCNRVDMRKVALAYELQE